MVSSHPVEPEELMAFLDGEVAADRAPAVAEHLKGCVECASLAEDFRQVSRRLMEWEVEPGNVPPVEAPPKPVWRWRKPVWTVGLAAAGILVLMMISPRQVSYQYNSSRPRVQAQLPAAVRPAPRSLVFNEEVPDLRVVMIARSAQLTLITNEFAHTRERLDAILKAHRGYMGQLTVNAPTGVGRTLGAALKVPSSELEASLAELKKLGRVESESQTGEEVTQQYVDLEARLTNARNTEQRLTTVLRQRADKMTDVLAVEKEIAGVRGEIEQMEAERKNLSARVEFATINVNVTEEYKAQLHGPESVGTRLANAAVAGYRNVAGGILGLAELVLEYGLSIVLWSALLFFPARFAWRRYRA